MFRKFLLSLALLAIFVVVFVAVVYAQGSNTVTSTSSGQIPNSGHTTTVQTWLIIVPLFAAGLVVVFGIFGGAWLKAQKYSNNILRETNCDLRLANQDQSLKYDKQAEQLCVMRNDYAGLQGEVAVLKAIPLQSISETLKEHLVELREVASTNGKILGALLAQAETLRANTETVATERAGVKSDLAAHDAVGK